MLPPEVLVFSSGPPSFNVPFKDERFTSVVVSGSLVDTPPPEVDASMAKFADLLTLTVMLPPEVFK